MAPTAFVHWPSAPLTFSLVSRPLFRISTPTDAVFCPPAKYDKLLQWSTYDDIDHDKTHEDRDNVLSSSYTIRKALIRKHYLARCLHAYSLKHPESALHFAVPRTWDLDISFADELEEMWADELYDLAEEMETGSGKWWILKPGMADRGMGIRLFDSKDALFRIFESFEDDEDDIDTQDDDTQRDDTAKKPEDLEGYKFHLRAYCVASGALKVYLYTRILALFSSLPFKLPASEDAKDANPNLARHLTNTSLQTHRGEEGVRLLDELVGCHILSDSQAKAGLRPLFTSEDVATIQDQIAEVLAETFKAAVETAVHFQPLPNAFELYGIDFLVSHVPASSSSPGGLQVQLLEVNAEPAIELTGPRLTWILEDLFEAIGKTCVEPFFSGRDTDDRDVIESMEYDTSRKVEI
ncbi:hypothetical protein EWM64_g2472 [Hericium alpestre]|uniref:Tubulin-tyrosine ligase n=1 Tax=Hericium alpestre TaxID=135208 RepID=A0A4Z0A3F6_9AGAM|nr:hypothetical protein EWM64_g2472 [Hericium alpestre]